MIHRSAFHQSADLTLECNWLIVPKKSRSDAKTSSFPDFLFEETWNSPSHHCRAWTPLVSVWLDNSELMSRLTGSSLKLIRVWNSIRRQKVPMRPHCVFIALKPFWAGSGIQLYGLRWGVSWVQMSRSVCATLPPLHVNHHILLLGERLIHYNPTPSCNSM